MKIKRIVGTFYAVVAALMTVSAAGAAMLEEKGLVTEKSAGWRFEASE